MGGIESERTTGVVSGDVGYMGVWILLGDCGEAVMDAGEPGSVGSGGNGENGVGD